MLVAVDGDPVNGADLTRSLVRLPDRPTPLLSGPLGLPLEDVQWDQWYGLALALLSADLLGCMEGALQAAIDYSRERVQFGRPIGSFQAIQHLCADAHVLTEGVRSATWYACWTIGRTDPLVAQAAARTAKVSASEAITVVTETAIQVHGGVAITWETLLHVFLRRGLLSRRTFGDESALLEAIADVRLGYRNELRDSPEEAAFRSDLHTWLIGNIPSEWPDPEDEEEHVSFLPQMAQ